MTGVSQAATSIAKNLTKNGSPQRTGGIRRFFRNLLPGKVNPQTPKFQAPKDQFVKAQADNLAAIKAEKVYFEKFTRQNQKHLAQDIKAFRQAQGQSMRPHANASPARQNVTGQSIGTGESVYKNGVNSQTGLSKSVEDRLTRLKGLDSNKTADQQIKALNDRFARLKGIDPNKTNAQQLKELNERLVRLKQPIPNAPPSLAKETADLEKLKKLPSNVQITPAQFQFETKRLKSLERIQQTRREIMADTKLTAAQRRKQLDGLNTILKDYT